MKFLYRAWLRPVACLAFILITHATPAADPSIQGLDRDGTLTWNLAPVPGVVTVESADSPAGPWFPGQNLFSTTDVGRASVVLSNARGYFRLLASPIPGTPEGHTNLITSFGVLETIAGMGEFDQDKRNNWLPQNEGGSALDVNLSRPHIAYADPQNNLLLVDEGSSSVLKITEDGRIGTYAGTHVNGFNGEGPAPATSLHLNFPNGGWMRADGVFYVMDTFNSRIRRIDTNGIMETLITQPVLNQFNQEGRGLWVRDDESEAYFCSGTTLSRWSPTGGVEVVRSDFLDLGNLVGDENRNVLYLTDRDAQRVYEFNLANSLLTPIAGNGTQSGGGDGFTALETGLQRPRTVAFFPNGGYLIGEHSPGYRVWYVDPAGIIHLWLSGSRDVHAGDGQWFYSNQGTPKIGKARAITMDRKGNIILVVNDHGYVRRIRFQRL